jgi:hypothetical protein
MGTVEEGAVVGLDHPHAGAGDLGDLKQAHPAASAFETNVLVRS